MKQDVANAIEELKQAFPSSTITSSEDDQGGAFVVIESVHIGKCFIPSFTWMGGHITAHYPYADIYPVFIDANVRRVDGKEFEAPITIGNKFLERPAIQISRRNNRVHSSPQTAVAKFLKIINFVENFQ